MNDWYQHMVAALQLNGKGEPTQKAYTRAVRMLCEFYRKTPDLISEPELQEYFLHRKNVNRWAPKTMRICYGGIRFFYVNVSAGAIASADAWHPSQIHFFSPRQSSLQNLQSQVP